MEIEFEITAPTFAADHPELHHYTDFNGLKGILESQTIWATHFSNLNDSTEVTLLQKPLCKAVADQAISTLDHLSNLNRNDRRRIKKTNRPEMIHDTAKKFVESLFGAAFKSDAIRPLAEPFITSFCAHTVSQAYEIENGLLSQWRAYGGTERYCLVFDTRELAKLLVHEFDSYYWIYMKLANVNYATPQATIETLFPALLENIKTDFTQALTGHPIAIERQTMVEFLSAAPRFKHQGFIEEQEVRIISIPATTHTLERMKAEHPDQHFNPIKPILNRGVPSDARQYLALFGGPSMNLPIKRIIVGPSSHQSENFAKARELADTKIDLRFSKTPFIG